MYTQVFLQYAWTRKALWTDGTVEFLIFLHVDFHVFLKPFKSCVGLVADRADVDFSPGLWSDHFN